MNPSLRKNLLIEITIFSSSVLKMILLHSEDTSRLNEVGCRICLSSVWFLLELVMLVKTEESSVLNFVGFKMVLPSQDGKSWS